ncbi:MAG: hypothetical protein ACE5HS_05850 [bacterium]
MDKKATILAGRELTGKREKNIDNVEKIYYFVAPFQAINLFQIWI